MFSRKKHSSSTHDSKQRGDNMTSQSLSKWFDTQSITVYDLAVFPFYCIISLSSLVRVRIRGCVCVSVYVCVEPAVFLFISVYGREILELLVWIELFLLIVPLKLLYTNGKILSFDEGFDAKWQSRTYVANDLRNSSWKVLLNLIYDFALKEGDLHRPVTNLYFSLFILSLHAGAFDTYEQASGIEIWETTLCNSKMTSKLLK